MRSRCPSHYCSTQAGGLTCPRPIRQSSSSHWDSISSSASTAGYPLCWYSPQLGAHLVDSLSTPCRKSGTSLPVAHSVISATSGSMLTPNRLRLRANTALYSVRRTCLHWNQKLGLAPNHKGRTLPVSLPVWPRPPLILMMVQWWEPWGVPGIRTVRAATTTVGPHLTWTHPERMWPTLIWSQPPGNVSHP